MVLDARGSQVVVQGWTENYRQDYLDRPTLRSLGVAALIYTDVDREARAPSQLERTASWRKPSTFRSRILRVKDLKISKRCWRRRRGGNGRDGGRALYEGSLDCQRRKAWLVRKNNKKNNFHD